MGSLDHPDAADLDESTATATGTPPVTDLMAGDT
jgi:hypothetical protein